MALQSDDRAVSTVVGATLVFGFLVIFLALYQATVVPNQNEQVEFDHSQAVQRDMTDARNAIVESKETGEDGFATVTLGTTYPPRTIAINPPPVTGSLRTTESQRFAVRDGNGDLVTDVVCPGDAVTRSLVYSPDYHVYTSGPDVVYENSVLYESFDTGNVLASGQTLVQGSEIDLIPLQGAYSRSGMQSVTFEAKAGTLDSTEVEQPEIELPTRLTESDWEELLAGEVDPQNVTVDPGEGNVTIAPDGEYTVNCGPVGANAVPPTGARGSGGTNINPAGPGDVTLVNGTIQGGNDQDVSVFFNNTAVNATNVTKAKLSFFFNSQGGETHTTVTIKNASTGTPSVTLDVGGAREVLSPEITLPAQRETELLFRFDAKVQEGDFFVVKLTFTDGGTGTYFVGPEA